MRFRIFTHVLRSLAAHSIHTKMQRIFPTPPRNTAMDKTKNSIEQIKSNEETISSLLHTNIHQHQYRQHTGDELPFRSFFPCCSSLQFVRDYRFGCLVQNSKRVKPHLVTKCLFLAYFGHRKPSPKSKSQQ